MNLQQFNALPIEKQAAFIKSYKNTAIGGMLIFNHQYVINKGDIAKHTEIGLMLDEWAKKQCERVAFDPKRHEELVYNGDIYRSDNVTCTIILLIGKGWGRQILEYKYPVHADVL